MFIVTKDENGRYECKVEGATGMYLIGTGASPVEAVGSLCIYSGVVKVRCVPPELLDEFEVSPDHRPPLVKAPSRED